MVDITDLSEFTYDPAKVDPFDYREEENAAAKERLEELYKQLDDVERWLQLDVYDVPPEDLDSVIPPGWKEVGDMARKVVEMYPGTIFRHVYMRRGLLRFWIDVDKTDPVKYNFLYGFTSFIPKFCADKCMITGEHARRYRQLPGWPCINATLATAYFNKLDEEQLILLKDDE